MEIGKTFLIIGIIFLTLGLVLTLGIKWPRIPGDLVLQKNGFTFFFPLASSLIISVILTILFNIFFRK